MKTSNTSLGALLGALLCFGQMPTFAQNLLSNGAFEAGNTGFTSVYVYSPGNLMPAGVYDVVRNPRDSHTGAASFTDHTTGTGFMLAVNGGYLIEQVLWSESIGVTIGTIYEFSGWAATWGTIGGGVDPNPSRFHVSINGTDITGPFQLAAANGQWQSFGGQWTSQGTGSALIQLQLETTQLTGNDPAFDDFRFAVVPEPSTLSLMGAIASIGLLVRWRKRSQQPLPPRCPARP